LIKAFDVEPELVKSLFNKEHLNTEEYSRVFADKTESSLPRFQFLFTEPNFYFTIGRLGRRKFNQKSNIFRQVIDQILAEDLFDINGNLLLKQDTILDTKILEMLSQAFTEKIIASFVLPNSTDTLYQLKIKSLNSSSKDIIFVLGFNGDLSEEKTYFDLADLVCAVSLLNNLNYGLGKPELETEKDELKNQIIRQAGDLIYNVFQNELNNLVRNISNRYLAQLSQFKRTDFTKIPNLKDFDKNLQNNFFHTSPLVQLQNQNNPLSEISYTQKLSVLGLGGFSSANTTFAARNINSSYYGRYDLVETPEGQRVGLIHNLTLGAKINKYGQIIVPYYRVQNGIVSSKIEYLTNEEEFDNYITHCDIKISEDNKIFDAEVLVRFRNDFI
jgi:DNA-directed RNA polymerase subunit beta